LAKEKIQVPLSFELGWRRPEERTRPAAVAAERADAQAALR
jgi:hypothetical protein